MDDLAGVFRALSDPFRLELYLFLRELVLTQDSPDERIAMSTLLDETTIRMNMSRPHVEHHLMELWRANILEIGESSDGQLEVRLCESVLTRTSEALRQLEIGERLL